MTSNDWKRKINKILSYVSGKFWIVQVLHLENLHYETNKLATK